MQKVRCTICTADGNVSDSRVFPGCVRHRLQHVLGAESGTRGLAVYWYTPSVRWNGFELHGLGTHEYKTVTIAV